jgi:transcription elongation factor GreB
MSKAFVKDDAPADEIPLVRREASPGTENYITPYGLAYFRDEIEQLHEKRRDLQKQSVPESDFRYLEITRRLQTLEQLISGAVVVDPMAADPSQVRFGATVTVEAEDGSERVYTLVGTGESDAKSGRISFASPIGKALLLTRVGDQVTVKTPAGEDELEIVKIEYLPIRF